MSLVNLTWLFVGWIIGMSVGYWAVRWMLQVKQSYQLRNELRRMKVQGWL